MAQSRQTGVPLDTQRPPSRLTGAHVHTPHAQVSCLNQPRGLCQCLGFGKGRVSLPVYFLALL